MRARVGTRAHPATISELPGRYVFLAEASADRCRSRRSRDAGSRAGHEPQKFGLGVKDLGGRSGEAPAGDGRLHHGLTARRERRRRLLPLSFRGTTRCWSACARSGASSGARTRGYASGEMALDYIISCRGCSIMRAHSVAVRLGCSPTVIMPPRSRSTGKSAGTRNMKRPTRAIFTPLKPGGAPKVAFSRRLSIGVQIWRAKSVFCAASSPHPLSTRACESSSGCRPEGNVNEFSKYSCEPDTQTTLVS